MAAIVASVPERSRSILHRHAAVEGFQSLDPSEEQEDDLLDMAWGLTPTSRLSCQAVVKDTDLTIEIPRYSINHAKEGR